jgi:hypothetical protein
MSWLSNAIATVETSVSNFFHSLKPGAQKFLAWLEPVLKTEAANVAGELAPIAESIVKDLLTSGKTSNEKRNEAVAQLQVAAKNAGIDVANSVLNFVVEAAYQKLQSVGQSGSTQAGATTPAPAPTVGA